MDPRVEHVEQALDNLWPATRLAARQRVGAQQQHRPNGLPVMGRADAYRVADQEVVLQAVGIGWVDPLCGELAETGRDAVNRLAGGDQLFDSPATRGHALARGRIEVTRQPSRATRPTSANVRSRPFSETLSIALSPMRREDRRAVA
jgi:hypothetical protein